MVPNCNKLANGQGEKKRERDEQLTGEYGRGRIIERLDYKNLKCLAHVDLQQNLKELNGEHNNGYLLS